MRKITNYNIDDEFYQPTQIDLGTAEKEDTQPIETPRPLAKGFDGLPKFNELQEAQKKNMPKAMRSQVAFQQKKLQYSNYQIINSNVSLTDSATSQSYYYANYNQAIAVGTQLDAGLMFGTSTADVSKAKYYNIVYINIRYADAKDTASPFLHSPSFVEFYPMQKIPTGDFGGKIPKQIEADANSTGILAWNSEGVEYGVQSFGVDVYNENAYYTQSKDLKGIRCIGIALKRVQLNFSGATTISDIRLNIEIGYDLRTEGNNY